MRPTAFVFGMVIVALAAAVATVLTPARSVHADETTSAPTPPAPAPAPAPAPVMDAPIPEPQGVTEVEVSTIKPKRTKHPTLRFLKENRDFLRAQLDLLRQTARQRAAGSDAIDPRHLAYQEMLTRILAAKDSTAASTDAFGRQALLESIRQLGDLETQLDLFEQLLADQRGRLARLEEDFTGRQETALIVLLSGAPGTTAPAMVEVKLEDSTTVRVPLAPEHRESLAHGGIAQLFHGFVEPREQVIAVTPSNGTVAGAGETLYVTLEPARNRLTFLRLHLGGSVAPGAPGTTSGGSGIKATTWLLEADTRLGAR
ncbi:MAG: hypothetical protein ACREOU_10990 [Candidatus Eiseniibacteriota bacterium]